jgi:hypothetical protein
MKNTQKVTSKKKKGKKPIVTIDMLTEEIKNIKNASITLDKDGKFHKIRASRNLYYLYDSKRFGFVIGWNELKKTSMHIENKEDLNDIITEITEYAKKA